MIINNFCTDDLLDLNRTWYTETPRLTKCLANVGFTIVPSLIFLIIIFFELFSIIHTSKKNNLIRFNKFNVCRFLICLFAIAINFLFLFNYIFTDSSTFTLSDLFASISKLVFSIIIAIVYHVHRLNGVITSGRMFFLFFLNTICSFVLLIDTLLYNQSMYDEFEVNNFYRIFFCNFGLFIMNCFTDDPIDAGLKPKNNGQTLLVNEEIRCSLDNSVEAEISPRVYSSFLSQLTFYWFTQIFKKTAKRSIHFNDIWDLEDDMKMQTISKCFDNEFYKELEHIEKINAESTKKVKFNSWNTVKVACRIYGAEILFANFLKFLTDLITFVDPILLSYMIRFVSNRDEPAWHGIVIVIAFFFNSMLKNFFVSFYNVRIYRVAINLKSAMMNLIFCKAMKISPKVKADRTTGQIVNLMSVDADKFSDFAPLFSYVWSSPLQIMIGLYLLYNQMGYAVFVGITIIGITMIIQYFLSKLRNKWFEKLMKIKDVRIKYINELLCSIKMIKFMGWENAFLAKITDERAKEINYLKKTYLNESFNWFIFSLSPIGVLICTISVYIFVMNGEFNSEKAFVAIAIFNILDFPVEVLPTIIAYIQMCKISLSRMSSFLAEEELEQYVTREPSDRFALTINKARFKWETVKEEEKIDQSHDNLSTLEESKNKKEPFELKDIELEVEKGKFIAIIGQVGCGKSSLISAILGEMHLIKNDNSSEKGKVNISEDQLICYVAQQAWIENDSFKLNVLFGKPFDSTKYEEVIRACALEADLKQFEAGDETEIGEKGINLSGGQKHRVSLARACYSSVSIGNHKHIVLLDDVLSAVDAHVGKHLCENVLNSTTGILRGSTRILVTNQLNQLNDLDVDQIILLKDGKIELKCSYDELMEKEKNGELDDYNLRLSQNQKENDDTEDEDKKSNKSVSSSSIQTSISTEISSDLEIKLEQNKKLIEKEKLEIGKVNFKNYVLYLKNFGIFYALLTLILLILENYFQIYSRVFLAEWTKIKLNTTDEHVVKKFHKDHMFIFGSYSLGQCIFNLIANSFIVIGIVNTIKLFHFQLLYKILRSKMSFFDTTPIGRILNRFSTDIAAIDQSLPRAMREFLLNVLKLFACVAILVIKQPNSFIFYFLIFVLYYLLMDAYIGSSRQLKRYHMTTKSPIFQHLSETLNGLLTVRAYNKVEEFERLTRFKIDINNRAFWYYLQGNRWLNFNLSLLASLVLLVVSIQTVFQKAKTDGSEAGLLISYALSITGYFSLVIRLATMFETNAVSVERINEYCNNEEEDKWIKDRRPDADWPSKGEIEFIDYSTHYREGTKLVLKNLSFKINEKEKISIVGRTGSGKSTTTLALFRIIEPVDGRIVIDNVDISEIGLHDLRSKISIIPQDAVLFTGTIRFNLDPFNQYSDDEIFKSLEHAHLRDFVNNLEKGIHHEIAEGGDNLSCGQKQLICLARTLVQSKNSKILVLDEATASIDFATDELVQKTIRSEFKNFTIITIAHRLNTVLDSSRILVLDQGELKEYDEPDKLLKDSNSMFYKLALKANAI